MNIPQRAQKASEILTVRINARTTPALIERARVQAGGNVSEFVRGLIAEALVKAEHKGK